MSDEGNIVEGTCIPLPHCSFPEQGLLNLGCMEAGPALQAEGHMWKACLGRDEATPCSLNITGVLLRGQCGPGPSWDWLQGPYSSYLGCVWDGKTSPSVEVPSGLKLPPPVSLVLQLRNGIMMEEEAATACGTTFGEGDYCSFEWREGPVDGVCYSWGKR